MDIEKGRKTMDSKGREKAKEALKAWRKKQADAGKCTICGKADERTASGATVCKSCLERCKINQRIRQDRLRAERRCTKCGKTDARTLSGLYLCAECQIKHAADQKARMARHVDGTCHRCGKVDARTQEGRYLCEWCAADARFRAKKYNRRKSGKY